MKRQAPRKEWLDLNETILEVIALAQYQLRRSAILLETRLGHHLPSVRGDRVQLMGPFRILTVNTPITMPPRARKRQEVLQALIAFGGNRSKRGRADRCVVAGFGAAVCGASINSIFSSTRPKSPGS